MPTASTNPDGSRARRRTALQAWPPERPDVLKLLASADIASIEMLPRGSNYTFLAHLETAEAGQSLAVYKPRRGEAPLWDFPDGTLYRREYAAWRLSRALGWPDIPPTVVREGPHGVGTLQLYIDHDPNEHYFTFGAKYREELKRVALFDVVTNNADRKGGHCLEGADGRIWCIDHGLTFHPQYKLRTVIWDFRGELVPAPEAADLAAVREQLETSGSDLRLDLKEWITSLEVSTLARRIDALLEAGVFPDYGPGRNSPWPPV